MSDNILYTSDSKPDSLYLDDGSEDRVVHVIYENQRRSPIKGWSAPFLPLDREEWSYEDGGESRCPKTLGLIPDGAWQWQDSWDVLDWEYSSAWGSKFHSKSKFFDSVRHRKWRRVRVRKKNFDRPASKYIFLKDLEDSGEENAFCSYEMLENITFDEVYENQRYFMFKWKSPKLLTDRSGFSNEDGSRETPLKEVTLPESANPEREWVWLTPTWFLDFSDPDCDLGGWQYAVDFTMTFGSNKGAVGKLMSVRRRRWLRPRVRVDLDVLNEVRCDFGKEEIVDWHKTATGGVHSKQFALERCVKSILFAVLWHIFRRSAPPGLAQADRFETVEFADSDREDSVKDESSDRESQREIPEKKKKKLKKRFSQRHDFQMSHNQSQRCVTDMSQFEKYARIFMMRCDALSFKDERQLPSSLNDLERDGRGTGLEKTESGVANGGDTQLDDKSDSSDFDARSVFSDVFAILSECYDSGPDTAYSETEAGALNARVDFVCRRMCAYSEQHEEDRRLMAALFLHEIFNFVASSASAEGDLESLDILAAFQQETREHESEEFGTITFDALAHMDGLLGYLEVEVEKIRKSTEYSVVGRWFRQQPEPAPLRQSMFRWRLQAEGSSRSDLTITEVGLAEAGETEGSSVPALISVQIVRVSSILIAWLKYYLRCPPEIAGSCVNMCARVFALQRLLARIDRYDPEVQEFDDLPSHSFDEDLKEIIRTAVRTCYNKNRSFYAKNILPPKESPPKPENPNGTDLYQRPSDGSDSSIANETKNGEPSKHSTESESTEIADGIQGDTSEAIENGSRPEESEIIDVTETTTNVFSTEIPKDKSPTEIVDRMSSVEITDETEATPKLPSTDSVNTRKSSTEITNGISSTKVTTGVAGMSADDWKEFGTYFLEDCAKDLLEYSVEFEFENPNIHPADISMTEFVSLISADIRDALKSHPDGLSDVFLELADLVNRINTMIAINRTRFTAPAYRQLISGALPDMKSEVAARAVLWLNEHKLKMSDWVLRAVETSGWEAIDAEDGQMFSPSVPAVFSILDTFMRTFLETVAPIPAPYRASLVNPFTHVIYELCGLFTCESGQGVDVDPDDESFDAETFSLASILGQYREKPLSDEFVTCPEVAPGLPTSELCVRLASLQMATEKVLAFSKTFCGHWRADMSDNDAIDDDHPILTLAVEEVSRHIAMIRFALACRILHATLEESEEAHLSTFMARIPREWFDALVRELGGLERVLGESDLEAVGTGIYERVLGFVLRALLCSTRMYTPDDHSPLLDDLADIYEVFGTFVDVDALLGLSESAQSVVDHMGLATFDLCTAYARAAELETGTVRESAVSQENGSEVTSSQDCTRNSVSQSTSEDQEAVSDKDDNEEEEELTALPSEALLRVLAHRAESRARHFAEEHDVQCPKWREENPKKRVASIHEIAASEFKYSLSLVILSGEHLIACDRFSGKSDPYVEVRFGEHKACTEVVKRSLSPVWNKRFGFGFNKDENCPKEIVLSCWDWDFGSDSDPMGECHIELEPYFNEFKEPEWCILRSKDNLLEEMGEIQVQIMVIETP
eukprot:22193_1